MPNDAIRVQLRQRFQPDQLRAVALAYRAKMGEGAGDGEASGAARAAFVAHGGDPAIAMMETGWMIATVAMQHGEWFWRPVKAYYAREEAALRFTGQWPGPLPMEERRRMAAVAMVAMDGAKRALEAGAG